MARMLKTPFGSARDFGRPCASPRAAHRAAASRTSSPRPPCSRCTTTRSSCSTTTLRTGPSCDVDSPPFIASTVCPSPSTSGTGCRAPRLEPLLDNARLLGLGKALAIMRIVSRMARESVEGQAIELDWVRRSVGSSAIATTASCRTRRPAGTRSSLRCRSGPSSAGIRRRTARAHPEVRHLSRDRLPDPGRSPQLAGGRGTIRQGSTGGDRWRGSGRSSFFT